MTLKKVLQIVLLVFAAIPILIISTDVQAYKFHQSCGPRWRTLPVQYLINEEGSRDLSDFSQVESLIQTSFETWQAPRCSAFESEYIGTTAETEVHRPGPVIFSFADDKFPRQFGGPNTIAITYFHMFYEDCSLNQAVIVYNGENHVFYVAESDEFDEDEERADFESITTHEVGHLLGLDHSRSQRATMYPTYMGGTEPRYLDDDDIKGVCKLYPSDWACRDTIECLLGQECIDGSCEEIPCATDDQCESDLVCLDGECMLKPCTLHSECDSGFSCNNNVCVSSCPTCRPCTMDEECTNGLCLDIGYGTHKCLLPCSLNEPCPGDSVCTMLSEPEDDEPFYLCLNPDFEQADACPAHYTCKEQDLEASEPEPGSSQIPRKKFQNDGCTSVGYSTYPQPKTQGILFMTALFAAAYTRKRRRTSKKTYRVGK